MPHDLQHLISTLSTRDVRAPISQARYAAKAGLLPDNMHAFVDVGREPSAHIRTHVCRGIKYF